jgi:hypothetical protein
VFLITWDYFRRVRKLDVKKWLSANKITSYVAFVKRLSALGVIPPLEAEVSVYFSTPKVTVDLSVDTAPKVIDQAPPAVTRRKRPTPKADA